MVNVFQYANGSRMFPSTQRGREAKVEESVRLMISRVGLVLRISASYNALAFVFCPIASKEGNP